MIRSTVDALVKGIVFVRKHPSFFLTLILIFIIPIAFVLSTKQSLDVARDNQNRLEKERIGLLHDVFLSLTVSTEANPEILQKEIDRLIQLNPDIVSFRISQKTEEGYVPIAAHTREVIGQREPVESSYSMAFVNRNDSIIETISVEGERHIRGVRLIEVSEEEYVLLTVTSRAATDQVFEQREMYAWLWLFLLLTIVFALVYRHIRLIDYQYLYTQAKRANDTRDMFTNMIAHELRAPLTAIRGYASMIKEAKETSKTSHKKEAHRIEESAERLLSIVNDLLDVAKIQSGKLAITQKRTDISTLIKSVCSTLAIIAKEKKITLSDSGTQKAYYALVDAKRMHQVLTNIVSNAIKYTQEGNIEVTIEQKDDRIEIRVKDTGMGISSKDQQKLFAPFFRVDSDTVRDITGTGLGMWITRQLVERMGGAIGVESIKGVGTHVVVEFPVSEI